ncbi:Crp/Fnr family transcriptional regulator [Archangium violaceum]|uniref:Crp/Fnr family transcriptional regulator n=1 Tax=Archangium violaceum TaxID=83451 RepID=UPI002B2EEA81|nr:Crp/Fnr family transcriptional regulator [Archangium violaceum]
MSAAPNVPDNRLLAALPAGDYERLQPYLEWVALEFKQLLFEVDAPIEHVYFPENLVVSILAVMPDGSAVEVATAGREGMVGLPVFLGSESMSAQAFVQVPGHAWRMSAGALREHSQRSEKLRAVLERYTQALFTQVSQGSACNRLHSIEERCARWLLMTQDRVGASKFPLTQQFLSQMLGVRRAGVSEVASTLQSEGLIRYSRGHVTIVDRERLEAAACECYGIIRREFDRLLDGGQSRGVAPVKVSQTSEEGRSTLGDGSPRPRRKSPRRKART